MMVAAQNNLSDTRVEWLNRDQLSGPLLPRDCYETVIKEMACVLMIVAKATRWGPASALA